MDVNALEAVWLSGMASMKIKGYDITAMLMSHALYGGGAELTFNNNSSVSKTIKKSEEYQAIVTQFKNEYNNSGKKHHSATIEFTDGDLYYSLQHVNIIGEHDDSGNLYLEIHDRYDFDNWRVLGEGLSIANLANDYGRALQLLGVISEYDICIKFYEGVSNTSGKLIRFVNVAIAELETGFKENNGDNITKYGAWYGMNGQPWCAMFVSWCANKAGILGTIVPKYCYCPYGVNAYERMGRYKRRSTGYLPKNGDIIFFQEAGVVSHTGIVIGCNSETKVVTTIEGNSGDAIRSNTYRLNDTYIHGYGTNGGTITSVTLESPTEHSITLLRIGSNGDAVKQLQTLLIARGYSCGSAGVDGEFGTGTYNAVIQFQKDHGLEVDGIVGPATWSALNDTSSDSNNTYKLLQKGSKGSAVIKLQQSLIAKGYSCGSAGADGDFGTGTYNAVVRFQKDHGLEVDGIVGPMTWNALLGNSLTGYNTLLRKGSKGSDVKALQQALISKGYSCGSAGADGDFGTGTYNAVIQFQRDNGLAVDGIVGPATWNALSNTTNDGSTLLKMGSTGLAVTRLQQALISKGYSCGSAGADGDFGTGTYNAVVRFQRDHGLEVDGIVGPATWNALNNSISSTGYLQKGSKGSEVVNLQLALIARGYSCGSAGADGDFGTGTYNAVVKFQKDHGLEVDGIVGPATWNALNTSSNNRALLQKGDTGNAVKMLQEALINKGYSCGSAGADGDFGTGTYNAVVSFQRDHGLEVDGIVGPITWNALNN